MLGSKFTFARLKYISGDWDTDQRMPANLLNSLLEYTTIPFDPVEKVVDLGKIEINKTENHPVSWSPIVGGVLLVGGIAMFFMAKKK